MDWVALNSRQSGSEYVEYSVNSYQKNVINNKKITQFKS